MGCLCSSQQRRCISIDGDALVLIAQQHQCAAFYTNFHSPGLDWHHLAAQVQVLLQDEEKSLMSLRILKNKIQASKPLESLWLWVGENQVQIFSLPFKESSRQQVSTAEQEYSQVQQSDSPFSSTAVFLAGRVSTGPEVY
ncbi:hypothetical protein NDU88_002736 [Pleurodeles waltl]|uniref:Uncharacterized protein n=1 Tax=Pleurodeles waltl TaxID=8319 RepID=A0AAV7Q7U5_PLEWA|nr:hypothetical protein NDU88_002736 [Pleurodeles waltl]